MSSRFEADLSKYSFEYLFEEYLRVLTVVEAFNFPDNLIGVEKAVVRKYDRNLKIHDLMALAHAKYMVSHVQHQMERNELGIPVKDFLLSLISKRAKREGKGIFALGELARRLNRGIISKKGIQLDLNLYCFVLKLFKDEGVDLSDDVKFARVLFMDVRLRALQLKVLVTALNLLIHEDVPKDFDDK